MASTSVGENQLQRIIRDLRDAVLELIKEHNECGEPITDDSSNLHKFSYKLEYLLQFDQKEKTTFLGQRKDYWDYFSDCLSKIKGANDGIRFVKSIPELKTSLGKGRAFIRYSLVHQRLADTLQQCLINHKVTSEWYYTRSPLLKSHLTADIINHLYELNQVLFDVASRGHDLDADWPTFARRTLGVNSPAYLWRPPSRCSSINSLVSSYSHSQVVEFPPNLELGHSILANLDELGEPASCSAADELRIELDQSELRRQALLAQVQASDREAVELRGVVQILRRQLLEHQKSSNQSPSSVLNTNPEEGNQETASYLQLTSNASNSALQDRLTTAENKNMELLTKLDGALSEKGQQTASYCDSAWKIQELIDKLKVAEEERLAAKREADDWARRSQQVSHELKLREDELRKAEEKLTKVKAAARGEREEALKRLEDLQGVVGRIEGALTLKEKEAGNLRSQLQDLQASLENRERQAEELKRKLQEERRDMTWRSGASNEVLESQLWDLREHLKNREKELANSSERVKHLEALLEKLDVKKQHLNTGNEVNPIDQSKMLEDYKSQCTSLMELNAKLLQTVKRSEASNRELSESRAAMRDQLASLTASQNPLKVQEEATMLSIEERETKLLEANQRLEEVVHKALLQSEASDATLKRLERDNKEIMETQLSLKKQLASTQEYLDALATKETQLGDQPLQCDSLQSRAGVLVSGAMKTDNEKSNAEKPEKVQKLYNAHQASFPEASSRHPLAEAQLELNLREVNKLQDEVVELRAQLLAGATERMKVQALQEVTEASREDLRMLVEQLKAQVEELNRRHVDEILHSREREDALGRERDGEARARDDLAAEVTASREQLHSLKRRYEAACLENGESREALHRANTETAELGVRVCLLTAENEEARLRWEGLSTRLQELEEEVAVREAERQNAAATEQLSRENQTLRMQISSQAMSHTHLLQAENRQYSEQIAGKSTQMSQSQSLIQQRDEELNQMKGKLLRTAEGLAVAEQACEEMSDRLRRANQEQQSRDVKMAAELDDLYRTKVNLEERLIELIRDKDELWQKSDALEFEQKLREEETERDINHCLGCHSQFSWWLRKYTCRLCGRPFCYYCCSNAVSTLQTGDGVGHRERCCRDCYDQHSAVVQRHPQDQQAANAPHAPFAALPQPGDRVAAGGDDGVFDIITEEEVSGVYDSDSLSFSTACSPGHGQQGAAQLNSSANAADDDAAATEEPEDAGASVVQDAEICLLKAGELTLSVPYALDDIVGFGDAPRELFVRSSCYSLIPITVGSAGPTVTWVFTSEPKSISFSVVYREDVHTPPESAKVLIPLTRCNSHKETIQGELKVRHPGEYTLVFDNSFSRFISKKVLYHLSVAKPVIYDGSDCPFSFQVLRSVPRDPVIPLTHRATVSGHLDGHSSLEAVSMEMQFVRRGPCGSCH
ncbi:FYVE and coiled-coil domain-containing protein 1 [Merluccius polli]|uniref:FYVE and coiled-coil domain-containing protein 1 n=1 Tax=Merluccius polli TaxID=89951 RepID=A0AA47M6K7_MERPO|nr:FYVE and coiled-coil domain-containing protein 1 [Merluccius polli]